MSLLSTIRRREPDRLAALDRYDVLDTPRERDFDDIAELASEICETPISVVNLIGQGRQFFKAEVGLGVRETPLETSFCGHAILEEDFMLIPDARHDPRFAGNPLVTGAPHLRFYAGALLKTPDGYPIGTLCVLDFAPRDLSDRQVRTLKRLARQVMTQLELRRALRDAREAEARHHQVLESAIDYAIITTDLDGLVTRWNAGAEAILGWSEREICGEPAHAFFTEEDRAAGIPEAEMKAARETGRGTDERWHQRRDGTRFWASGKMMPLTAEGGAHVGYLKILRDRTAQRQVAERSALTERALADSERRFRAITDSVDQMIWSTLPDGYHDYYNQRWYDYTGVPPGSTDGEAWNGMFHPDDQERAWALWRGCLATGEPYHIEYRLRHRTGEYRWVLGRAQPQRDEAGTIVRWFGSCTDIQDIVDAREVLARSRVELEGLVTARTQELRSTEEALRQSQKMEAVGQLTGGIAHDFNNLLTGIVGSLDLMQTRIDQGRTENIERYAKAAMSSANRAAALTHRLLAFARRQPLDSKPTDSNQLVTSLEDLLRRTLGEAINLEIVTAGGLWPTLCDPHQLESAILNLAINARDAMPGGGKLTIETGNTHLDLAYARLHPDVEPGQYVCICVTDTGAGMTPDVIAKAFDPFFTTKPLGQGTGLGLSMVYGFARQSEGHAVIYSEEGQGTTVKIYLPRYRGEVPAEGEEPGSGASRRAEHGETVLVVEDEAVVRDLIVEVLGDLGYRALEAQDGPSALLIAQSRERIDLLVTDVGLPGLNGRQLADQARESRPGLKVLFITGYAENATFGNGHLDPGMQMITKPFPVDALAQRIRQMIES